MGYRNIKKQKNLLFSSNWGFWFFNVLGQRILPILLECPYWCMVKSPDLMGLGSFVELQQGWVGWEWDRWCVKIILLWHECTKINPQYPDYLADNREKLSEEKYAAYNKQCELTRRFFFIQKVFREVYTFLFLIWLFEDLLQVRGGGREEGHRRHEEGEVQCNHGNDAGDFLSNNIFEQK